MKASPATALTRESSADNALQALRRSIKGEKNGSKPQHISITPKSAVAIVPPKKVIRALYDYDAQSTQELGFSKGDFFHVIGRENDKEWYEACNPSLPDARGLVPVAYFQVLGKQERNSGGSPQSARLPDHDSGYSDTSVTSMQNAGPRMSKASEKGSSIMIFGVVEHDFAAQRPDELEATHGEPIIIIAQSNHEWVVAKPIKRLGGPGLIPISHINILNMSTKEVYEDSLDAIQRAGIPKVEEWKKMAADYKNSSITLGKFSTPNSQQQSLEQGMGRMSLQQGQSNAQAYQQQRQSQDARAQQAQQPYFSKSPTQLYAPISARIPRYCFAEDKYWFVIEAALEDGRHWELSRYYEDFYDFQIALLTAFPVAAGNEPNEKGVLSRTLPYMPGPVSYVTDAITEGRQHNLDEYVKKLLTQQPPHIARCDLVKQFFEPREGDYEMDPNAVNEEYRLSGGSGQSSNDSPINATPARSPQKGFQGSLSAGGPQGPSRQNSSLSQPSTNSLSSPQNGQQQASAMKVKIYFGDDLIAIRVPTDIQFPQLYEKICERLKIPQGEEISLSYKDEARDERPYLMSNDDLDEALRRNDKLIIYVDYA
ncbi:scd2/ral3 [Bisporella sp. PMI_857]|nr:scd2/ral3 [Bisporella sp. PMI_857]